MNYRNFPEVGHGKSTLQNESCCSTFMRCQAGCFGCQGEDDPSFTISFITCCIKLILGCGCASDILSFTAPTQHNLEKAVKRLRQDDELDVPKRYQKFEVISKSPANVHVILTGKERRNRCFVHVHGGINCCGPAFMHWDYLVTMAQRVDADACMLRYGRCPEVDAVTALETLVKDYKYLLNLYGGDGLVLSGDSAGGGRILSLLMKIREEGTDYQKKMPKFISLLSPWVDVSCSTIQRDHDLIINVNDAKNLGSIYAAKIPVDDWRVSPLFGSFEGLPPIFSSACCDEILLDDVKQMHEKATKEGVKSEVVLANLCHPFQLFLNIPESKKLADEVVMRIKQEFEETQSYQDVDKVQLDFKKQS